MRTGSCPSSCQEAGVDRFFAVNQANDFSVSTLFLKNKRIQQHFIGITRFFTPDLQDLYRRSLH